MAELEWVHEAIRHDLDVCKDLAAKVAAGDDPEEVHAGIRALKRGGPLWRLGVNCLRYCRFVHGHHHAEDVRMFPAVRESNPALGPVVDKLEADHREVAVRLDDIEAAANTLDNVGNRTRLSDALDGVTAVLLEHLAFEEEAIGPTILGWSHWPTQVSSSSE